jgi:hypothetical protein
MGKNNLMFLHFVDFERVTKAKTLPNKPPFYKTTRFKSSDSYLTVI